MKHVINSLPDGQTSIHCYQSWR